MVTTAPVTVEQAAAILGVSASTIRRRIRAGSLRVEQVRRPQGVVWLVHLPPGTAPAAKTATVDTGSVTTTATTPTPPADAIAALIRATLAPIVAPLVAEQAALRQVVERQADQLVRSAEERGRLAAELEQARARLVELESPAEPERLAELARENGTLAERLAVQKRLREAAMAHAAELEQKLEAASRHHPPEPPVEEIAALRAEHDRHAGELARADATLAGQAASHARVSRQVRRLWIALAVAGALAVVAGLAPAWVR